MRSKEWRQKRGWALEHHGAKCNRCGSTQFLEVHHLHYKNFRHEQMEDLEVLCENCHVKEHPKYAVARTQRRDGKQPTDRMRMAWLEVVMETRSAQVHFAPSYGYSLNLYRPDGCFEGDTLRKCIDQGMAE
jgi:hypothetical protein